MAILLSHIVGEEHLILSNERTLFWENENVLIIADLHVGKTSHFRKAGIGVPSGVYKDDLHRLLAQILFFKAEKLIIAGDLTHSIANMEMDLFRKWRKDFPLLEVHLAKGNHDILDNRWYEEANIKVHNDPFAIKDFLFVHDIMKPKITVAPGKFVFSGHVHPGITIRGRGKQSLRFPCFYFTKTHCILPAFSHFTGTYRVEPKKGEDVFAIVEKEIMPLQANTV
jgi:DNA ligase-associated metallophosphoesterase